MHTFNVVRVTLCFTLALVACAEEAAVEDTCVWVFDPAECKYRETLADEVGDGDGDPYDEEAAPLAEGEGNEPAPDPGVCLSEPNGHTKTLHQCEGSLEVSIEFDTFLGDCAKTLGSPAYCTEVHEFGPEHDTYDAPAVMACCDPLDPEAVDDGAYLQHCVADSIEQICRSLPMRLQKYIDDGLLTVGKNQAQKLQAWLAQEEHLQECYDALYDPAGVSGELGTATWAVNGGDNSEWKLLDGFRVTLEYAVVDAVALPENPQDWLACVDSNHNNTEIFEYRVPGPAGLVGGVNSLVGPATATMTGPELFGGAVSGSAPINSPGRSCRPWCSTMELISDNLAGTWALTELELFAEAPIVVGNTGFNVQVDRGALRLYGIAEGEIIHERDGSARQIIDARSASFVLSGVTGQTCDIRWATNASPIVARETTEGWRLDAFEIEHYDSFGARWTIAITPTTWK